ncbi:MAG: S41 family peptidase, partial [Bacteroidota bacterium]
MKTFYLLLLISLMGLNSELLAQGGPQILSAEAWTEDLEELYELLKKEHRDLFFKTDPGIFEEEFQRIKRLIPQWPDHKIIAEFARLAALANDGHTRLTLPLQAGIGLSQAHSKTPLPSKDQLVFRHLPLEFYWFDDGIYVLKAIPSMQKHIGKKLLKINETPVEKALESVKGLCHFDNEYGYKLIAPSRLSMLEILMALDIVGENEEVLLQLESDQGREEISLHALDRFTEERLGEKAMQENLVLSRQKNDQYYWFEYLEEENAMYLQINQMNRAESGIGLIRFLGDLHLAIQEHKVDRLILDLRNNFGGSNGYALPIANLLVKNPKLNQFGKFYTLIGRKTFSAAQYLVNDLSKWTNVIFVGEPTGATPSHYGDSKKKQLRHS